MNYRPSLVALACALALGTNAQTPRTPQGAVDKARTLTIKPQPKPPKWMNYDEIQSAYAFLGRHRKTAEQIMGTSSLAATFAAKDIAPVLMQTGRLPTAFQQRMRDTGIWMDAIFDAPESKDDFVQREYIKAVALGAFHASVAKMVRADLMWNPRERVPVNGQSFAFVLYTFAWQPIETMIATKEVDPVRDAKDLEAWFHFWSVVGYGMGVPENLLPRDFATAEGTMAILRTAQYASPGEPVPSGIPDLLGGHVRMIAAQLAAQFKKKPADMTPAAALALASSFSMSPGLTDALGLGNQPVAKLLEYAARPVPK